MDEQRQNLEVVMSEIRKDCKNPDMKFAVLRRIRALAQARERKRRVLVRAGCLVLLVLFGWMTWRAGDLFPAGPSIILDPLLYLVRGSLFLLATAAAWVFTLSFQAREKG